MTRVLVAFALIIAGILAFFFTAFDGRANSADLIGIASLIIGLLLLWRKS